MAKWCVLLSRATGRAIADLKGHDLDNGPLSPPSPAYAQLLVTEGFDPEKPDLDRLLSKARRVPSFPAHGGHRPGRERGSGLTRAFYSK